MTPFLALMLGIVELSLPILRRVYSRRGGRGANTVSPTKLRIRGQLMVPRRLAIQAVVQNQRHGIPCRGTAASEPDRGAVFLPVSPFTEVTGTSTANRDGNVLQVSVQGYNHAWIAPVLWFWGPTNFSVTTGTLVIAAISADRLESFPGSASRPSS